MKMNVDEIHRIAFEQYQRLGHVTLSGELARELFTNIPNREKQLEAALEASRGNNQRLAADLARVVAYARELETWVIGCTSDDDGIAELRGEHGVADLMGEDR